MTTRLQVSHDIAATPERVWDEITDWAGQARWIPLTTVRTGEQTDGVGVRAEALSGLWLGPLPLGLLDRFVVTGWTPPVDGPGELEVLHLGPYFTGEGVFRVEPHGAGTRMVCTELINVPGGRAVDAVLGALLPLMRSAFATSLVKLARVAEADRSAA